MLLCEVILSVLIIVKQPLLSCDMLEVRTMANNNLNAADIDGSTIASILKQQREQSKEEQANVIQRRLSPFAISQLRKSNVEDVRLLIIDEISNVTTHKLGELSRLFSEARQNKEEVFGGIPILMVGDFNQKGPVGGTLATMSLMKKVMENKSLHIQSKARPPQNNPKLHYECKIARQIFEPLCKRQKRDSFVTQNQRNCASDNSIGCEILA